MAENSGIEFNNHINPSAKGRQMGAYKSAAAKCGVSVEYWIKNRMNGLNHCYRCRIWKKFNQFSLDNTRKGGRASICKNCCSKASTASRYSMNPAELENFKAAHNHSCAVCQSKKKLVIDHDHETGVVRGLLCNSCNVAIGLLGDSLSSLKRAVLYLEKYHG